MSPCIHDACGKPRTKHGPPPKGWVFVKVVRQSGVWYCTPEHAFNALTGQAPPPRPVAPTAVVAHQPRPDITDCPLCINRHDRQHRCGICNTAPQIVRPAPAPARLYHHHAQDKTA